ncbi:MAG: hypothetical protein FWB90_02815 [Fibromonadales bacterium]|nr:hypothetical protein [Fibromonadales bacterium]
MYGVEIRHNSYYSNPPKFPWLDHIGNPINKLTFDKDNYEFPGHYPVQSFGSLYRNIDDFRNSPLQSLSDWEITLPSIYSSKDGMFKTMDLFYWLEAINEGKESGEEFNLIGCEAILFDSENHDIYRGTVISIKSETGKTSISIRENIDSPEIKKSDFPLVLGNAEARYWPIKIEKNETTMDIIVISERQLERFDGFFIWLEDASRFHPVVFKDERNLFYSEGHKTAFLLNDSITWTLERAIYEGQPFKINFDLPYSNDKVKIFRPDFNKESPDNYMVGTDENAEFIQAWSSRGADIVDGSSGWIYLLGRDLPDRQKLHKAGATIRKIDNLKSSEIKMNFDEAPISLTVKSTASSVSTPPFTSGNPSFFLEASKQHNRENLIEWNDYPSIDTTTYASSYATTVTFNFSLHNLPSSTRVTALSVKILAKTTDQIFGRFKVGNASTNENVMIFNKSWKTIDIPIAEPIEYSALKKIEFELTSRNDPSFPRTGTITLGALYIDFEVIMPFDEIKLYASGKIESLSDSDSGKPVIDSINGLLKASSVLNYSVQGIGNLNETRYGSIISNEAVLFRDKLRSLASESATLVKHSPNAKKYLVKSISRQFDFQPKLIPLDAIMLENNMYNFTMESAYRNDILNGILISWGKNFETGEYEHTLTIDFPNVYRDGEPWDMQNSILGAKWNAVKEQLEKNKADNIGIIKSIDSEWIIDWEGAEIMAYNYLCWNCSPLRKAQINCITPLYRALNLDIGDYVHIDLPGYPPKFVQTAWIITGANDDLDKIITNLELLEVWNMPVISPDRYILKEDGGNILTEASEKIKLESINV